MNSLSSLTLKPALIIAVAALALTGCATTSTSGTSSPSASGSSSEVATNAYASVIDVRTPEEWNMGRLDGAVLMSVESFDFESQISQLDPSKDYFIYCRSGNRAGVAIDIMRQKGFTGTLVNGGSVEQASATLNTSIVR